MSTSGSPRGNTGSLHIVESISAEAVTFPLQSLAADASFAPTEVGGLDSPEPVSRRGGPVVGVVDPSTRSRGVGVIFRVCTTSGSGLSVHRSGFDLSPLDVDLAVFPEVACLLPNGNEQPGFRRNRATPLVIFTSPSESDLTARPPSCAVPEGTGA